jgi:CHAP domain
MTLDEFIKQNIGKKLDFDGKYENQCVDLYRFYVRDVWKLPQTPGVKGAFQILGSLPKHFEIIRSGIPKRGDVIIWNEWLIKNGHVAVVVSANSKTFEALQQNAPKAYQPVNIATYTYKNVIGWFRPINKINEKTMKPQYIEQDGKIGLIFDYGSYSIIQWASDPAFGDQLTKQFLPEGDVLKITKK